MDETTRLCPACKQLVTEIDERQGQCPHCRQPLLTLADYVQDPGAGAYWLWVDPRLESGYDPKTFDEAAFLARAVVLFQSKERWGGQRPVMVMANPAQADNGLEPVAETLGLRVVGDPTVAAGTYRLGLRSTAVRSRSATSAAVAPERKPSKVLLST